jgi:hypothetical protein
MTAREGLVEALESRDVVLHHRLDRGLPIPDSNVSGESRVLGSVPTGTK